MRVSAEVDERTLREIYLPAFEHIVTTARPWTVMAAYNRVNGVHAAGPLMLRESFNDGWQCRPKVNPFAELSGPAVPFLPVTVPHDAMLGGQRDPGADPAGAYFPGGAWEYRKTFHLPEHLHGKRIMLEFEGVYRDATVHINGAYAGQRPYGYSLFRIDAGAVWGRKLAEKVRALDATRYVTNGVNNMLAVMSDLAALRGDRKPADGEGINTAMAQAGVMMNMIGQSELVTRRTAESYGLLDVAGMNYSESRYAMDRDLFPNRIILGTETFPTRIDELWDLVQQHSHVIGDFTWTGWDYLGEVGIGRPQYPGPGATPTFAAPYPHLVAGTGDMDIIGHRRPASRYREIVFGLRSQPYLAVRRPQNHGTTFMGTPWAWSDSINSWTWPGFEGRPITVEVYAAADEVELVVNGESAGRRPIERFRTEFDVTYQPGEALVVAYRQGVEIGRDQLRTATGPLTLRARSGRPAIAATGGDLAFVAVTLTAADGIVHTGADLPITVEVTGDGVLAAFGSANPSTEQRYDRSTHTTYEGRALAVLRPTGPGTIHLTATAPGHAPAELLIAVEKEPLNGRFRKDTQTTK